MDEAIEIRVEPSRLLYGIDRSAYIEVLKTVNEVRAEAVDEAEEEAPSEEAEQPEVVTPPPAAPLVEVVPIYSGRLAVLRDAWMGS